MWLTTMRRYLAAVAAGSLAWESAQLPLYTIWAAGRPAELLYAVLHCTLGDVLIATGALGLALAIAGGGWPASGRAYIAVAALAVAFGLGYTVYSEWLNVAVRQSWAYAPWMPRVPPLGTGLAPLLQWIAVPALAFRFAALRPGNALAQTQASTWRRLTWIKAPQGAPGTIVRTKDRSKP
jgi:hypothetical protein